MSEDRTRAADETLPVRVADHLTRTLVGVSGIRVVTVVSAEESDEFRVSGELDDGTFVVATVRVVHAEVPEWGIRR